MKLEENDEVEASNIKTVLPKHKLKQISKEVKKEAEAHHKKQGNIHLKQAVAQEYGPEEVETEQEFNNFVESMAQTAQKQLFGDARLSADSFVQRKVSKRVDIFKEAAKQAVESPKNDKKEEKSLNQIALAEKIDNNEIQKKLDAEEKAQKNLNLATPAPAPVQKPVQHAVTTQ